jgi:probable HAF family extracellular repeat protein
MVKRRLLVLFLMSVSGYAQTHRYQIIDLGVLPGQSDSIAFGINASGTVVGRSGSRAFFYKNCQMADLGLLPGGLSAIAVAINNNGMVAGYAGGSDQGTHAVSWHDGSIHLLEPGNTYQSQAAAVSSPGKVIGYEYDGKVAYATAYVNDQPVVVPSDDDPTYGWASLAVATGGNGSGQLIGYRPTYNSLNEFISMLGLITPPGSNSWVRITPPSGYSQLLYPWAINEDGAVAGWAENSASVGHFSLLSRTVRQVIWARLAVRAVWASP